MRNLIAFFLLLGLAAGGHAATLVWQGTDSLSELRSVKQGKDIFLQLDDIAGTLPLTVYRDLDAGLVVLCSPLDCVPVFLQDADDVALVPDKTYIGDPEQSLRGVPQQDPAVVPVPFINVRLVAGVLGCDLRLRKKERVELTCPGPLPRVGAQERNVAPGFRLPAADGVIVSLADLLRNGPVALIFVRSGAWDPFSQALLTKLETVRDSLAGAGVQPLAIHGYDAPLGGQWADSLNLHYPLLADQLSAVMRGYEVFDKGNLPYPAMFLIDRNGIIRMRYVYTDLNVLPVITPLLDAVGRL